MSSFMRTKKPVVTSLSFPQYNERKASAGSVSRQCWWATLCV